VNVFDRLREDNSTGFPFSAGLTAMELTDSSSMVFDGGEEFFIEKNDMKVKKTDTFKSLTFNYSNWSAYGVIFLIHSMVCGVFPVHLLGALMNLNQHGFKKYKSSYEKICKLTLNHQKSSFMEAMIRLAESFFDESSFKRFEILLSNHFGNEEMSLKSLENPGPFVADIAKLLISSIKDQGFCSSTPNYLVLTLITFKPRSLPPNNHTAYLSIVCGFILSCFGFKVVRDSLYDSELYAQTREQISLMTKEKYKFGGTIRVYLMSTKSQSKLDNPTPPMFTPLKLKNSLSVRLDVEQVTLNEPTTFAKKSHQPRRTSRTQSATRPKPSSVSTSTRHN
jgi:hypothetical protein